MTRIGTYSRTTGETSVSVTIGLDGSGQASISTGQGMLDHLLNQLSRHGLIDLDVKAEGDSALTGWHHTVEDTGIALGRAFAQAIGDGAGIRRMGHALVPLDETLAQVALDISGRGYAVVNLGVSGSFIAGLPGDLVRHFLEAFAIEARVTLHVRVLEGSERPPQGRGVVQGAGQGDARRRRTRPPRRRPNPQHQGHDQRVGAPGAQKRPRNPETGSAYTGLARNRSARDACGGMRTCADSDSYAHPHPCAYSYPHSGANADSNPNSRAHAHPCPHSHSNFSPM